MRNLFICLILVALVWVTKGDPEGFLGVSTSLGAVCFLACCYGTLVREIYAAIASGNPFSWSRDRLLESHSGMGDGVSTGLRQFRGRFFFVCT